jgi:hypothetical protein
MNANINFPENDGLIFKNRYYYYVHYQDAISEDKNLEIDVPSKILDPKFLIVKFLDQKLEYLIHYKLSENFDKLIMYKDSVPKLIARQIVEMYIYDIQ